MSSPKAVLAPRYTLPDLDYDFGALEPHISGKIMELHHGKHHAGYVKNTNLTITLLEEARATEDFTHLAALERALAFNLSEDGLLQGGLAPVELEGRRGLTAGRRPPWSVRVSK